jgi:bud site selection protein 20
MEEKLGKKMEFDADDDLPGLGLFYCTPCARHFIDSQALEEHMSSKVHKRRLKDVAQEQYTQAEADAAAGKTKEILPPVNSLRMSSSMMG